ncbi:hypothetical protein LCGC14_3086760 [marine sediment metagenome]|uniref:Uncharacterized protein n=1 Tax=marine sediment metagenome TaxID=412755 RepID=A0A0F8WCB9_9ZZZZ
MATLMTTSEGMIELIAPAIATNVIRKLIILSS